RTRAKRFLAETRLAAGHSSTCYGDSVTGK
ncbi:hypothetical protein ABIB60_004430, partial [Hymenobacter sp. UYP22]